MPELEDLRLVRCDHDEVLKGYGCPYCDGTGLEIIETAPIEQDDLDIMCGT